MDPISPRNADATLRRCFRSARIVAHIDGSATKSPPRSALRRGVATSVHRGSMSNTSKRKETSADERACTPSKGRSDFIHKVNNVPQKVRRRCRLEHRERVVVDAIPHGLGPCENSGLNSGKLPSRSSPYNLLHTAATVGYAAFRYGSLSRQYRSLSMRRSKHRPRGDYAANQFSMWRSPTRA